MSRDKQLWRKMAKIENKLMNIFLICLGKITKINILKEDFSLKGKNAIKWCIFSFFF